MSCYVCLEECEERGACLCRMRVHDTCRLRVVRESQANACSICKGEYLDIALRSLETRRLSSQGKIAVQMALLGGAVLAGSVTEVVFGLRLLRQTPSLAYGLLVLGSVFGGVAFQACASAAVSARRHGLWTFEQAQFYEIARA